MIIKCNNCGTPSNYREYGKLKSSGDRGARIVQIYKCACGRARHQVFWKVDGVVEWMDDKMISANFQKNS